MKPNKLDSQRARIALPADRFEATAVTLLGLIALAYGEPGPPPQIRPNDQIVGGPNWVNSDLFDIVAKTDGEVAAGPAGVAAKLQMLRTLLEERFGLALHHENREARIYALVLARADGRLGPQLRRSNVDCRDLLMARGGAPGPPRAAGERPRCRAVVAPSGTMNAGSVTMSDLANTLSRVTNRIVRDRTGVTGAFDVDLGFNPSGVDGLGPIDPDREASDDTRPSLFTALQEQLGLKLDPTTGVVDVLVIDSAVHPVPD